MKRIHDSLKTVFERHRLVFWYDPAGEWRAAFETFDGEAAGIRKREVNGDEFGVKVAIHQAGRGAKWLVYVPAACPPDNDNWLLDLLLQGYEYKADRASLAVQEAGLDYALQPVVEAHIKFFESPRRVQALQALARADDSESSLRLKLMAVALNSEPAVDALVLACFAQSEPNAIVDPVAEALGSFNLAEPFWKEVQRAFGYAGAETFADFAITLFRAANPLDAGVALDPHARAFLAYWKDSQTHSAHYRRWAGVLEKTLRIEDQLHAARDARDLRGDDTFPAFEKFALASLRDAFVAGDIAGKELAGWIAQRRGSIWFGEHEDGYGALREAIELREGIAGAELHFGSIDAGINGYIETWHRVDGAYRRFCRHQQRYPHTALLAAVAAWADKAYVNQFLLPLADQWSDRVRAMEMWRAGALLAQTRFFDHHIRPFVAKKQKVFVIISDALRYEAAAELAARVRAENRWTAELGALLASAPSYTQLGMASLLPGDARAIQPDTMNVQVDGLTSAGTEARRQMLAQAAGMKATAVQARDFMELSTKGDARALLRDHDVVFIYHDVIDMRSHGLQVEQTSAANVANALDELMQLLRKIYSANGYNMLVTADHGFLFQQAGIDAGDDVALPAATDWLHKDRRFALGRGIAESSTVKVFTAKQLGLEGDWQAAFPLSLGRFPLQGAGKRFLHGGLSLQEVIVPVLHVHVARADDAAQVEVDLISPPATITTGQVALALYQDRPACGKSPGRALRVGVFAEDGRALSEVKALNFDSGETEPRRREQRVTLALSRAADDYNNKDVEIVLLETIAGTTQAYPYKRYRTRLTKPFASDFDD